MLSHARPRLSSTKRILQRLRGIIGAAFTWAVLWSVAGIGVLVAYAIGSGNARFLDSPLALLRIAELAVQTFGFLGACSGATFAAVLALSGRGLTFERLRGRRMAAYGAAGSTIVCGGLMAFITIAQSVNFWQPTTFLAIFAGLGAGSGWLMWRLARRGADTKPPAELGAGEQTSRWGATEKEATWRAAK